MDAGEQARPCGLQHIVGVGGSQAEAASDAAQWPLEARTQTSRPSLPKELCDELDPVDTWRDALAAAGDD